MPVFISHRTADDALARSIYGHLTTVHGIPCYLDDLDKAGTSSTTHLITRLIVGRLLSCTNLLAVVTSNTRGSWWVPFEVGVARQGPRMISTFASLAQHELPEYLTEWPVLRGHGALDTFAAYYKAQAPAARIILSERGAATGDASARVDSFHRQLKAALGQ